MGGSSKKQTTGYTYYMGLHMGLCLGPIDALLEIRAGDRTAWSGQRYTVSTTIFGVTTAVQVGGSSPVTANETIYISAPNLFGGKKREGGLQGYLDVMMGASTQGTNAYLASKQTGPQPAYRGIVSLVYRGGMIAANNPYIKPWAFLCRRVLQGWGGGTVWYSAKAEIDVGGGLIGMNPAHIIVECLTNREWGMGYPIGQIDSASFIAAADTFHTEAFGLCMQWARQERIGNFIQLVCDHVGAAVGEDPRTGLWKIKPIRDDYDIDDLQVFSPEAGNIVELQSFERTAPDEVVSELTVTFSDIARAKDGSVTGHNLSFIASQGQPIAETRSYPGLPTLKLATQVMRRDLRSLGAGTARVKFTATRAAYGLLPGDVIAFSWPPLGIALMAIRIARVNYGTLDKGLITIEAAEDVFGLPDSTFVAPPAIGWEPPSLDPVASPNVSAFETPYRDIASRVGAANAEALGVTSGFVAGVARKPTGLSADYEFRTKLGAAAYAQVDDADWCPTATLAANITPTTTSITLSNVIDLDQIEIGSACLIGTEVCRIDTFNVLTNSITVGRGCADTVPVAWTAGTRVWFYETFAAIDGSEYVLGEAVDTQFITRATGGELDPALAPTSSVTIAQRAARPYPPGRLRINGAAYPATAYARLSLAWAHRDRILQQDTLVDAEQVSIGPEAGTTYTVRVYQQPSTLLHTQTGITGTSLTYEHELDADLRVEVESVRGGLTSWQMNSHVIACTGSSLVVNGGFAADTDWTKGTGWTIAAGVATKAAGVADDLSQAIPLVAGGVYMVEFTVSGYAAGTVLARFAGGTPTSGIARSANGTYTQDLTASAGNNELRIVADAAFSGNIDAVRVRRVA